jgi:DNA-binding transcriptional MerR regulator
VNEGLLPQPERPKPNTALYAEKCIKIIKFIRFFQKSLYYSIAQIKEIIKNNTLDFDDSLDMIFTSLDVMSIGEKIFSEAKVLKETQINSQQLQDFKDAGLIRQDDCFSSKDIEMINILKQSTQTQDLLRAYVESAKALAILENQIGARVLSNSSPNNSAYQLMFDTVLKLKPYIFNSHTLAQNKLIHSEKI